MDITSQLILFFFFLFVSAFSGASEAALVSLPNQKVRQMGQHRKFGAEYIRKLKEHPQRMLSTILILNNLVNTAAAALMTAISLSLFGDWAISIATGIATLLILIFGDIMPKTLAVARNEAVAQVAGPVIWWASIALKPAVNMIDWILKRTFRLFGLSTREQAITKDEIRHLVAAAEEEGSINESERRMVHNIFRFDDLTAGEIMTPRTDIIAVPVTGTVEDAMEIIAAKQRSRIPVYDGDLDHIVGIVYVKDLVGHAGKSKSIKAAMKTPHFVPETKRISELLKRFQKNKKHMAVVVNEHGSVVGLVTLEDVLEEIVGEIADETERVEINVAQKKDGVWIIKGKTPISEINEKFGTRLDNAHYDTISGFVMNKLGRIPGEGDDVTYSKWRFTVKKIVGNRIVEIQVKKK